jgi:dUTP pyrophosphatase
MDKKDVIFSNTMTSDLIRRPNRKHPNDAGIDVYATKTVIVPGLSSRIIHTGVTFDIEPGYGMFAFAKSSAKFAVGAGVIDSGYQGEIMIKVINYGIFPRIIKKFSPVAQLVKVAINTGLLMQVPNAHSYTSERGTHSGF